MLRKSLASVLSLAFTLSAGATTNTTASQSNLTASEIADKNIAARGGLQAWRGVQTMSLSGKMGIGGNQRGHIAPTPPRSASRASAAAMVPQRPVEEAQAPFLMELKRPGKMRFELQFAGDTALQVFDGTNGWKLRPYLNRRQVEPYTPEEIKSAATQTEVDGLIVDYAAKGTRIELVGSDRVEGRDAYKLKLTMKDGHEMHVWIDAQTFLEAKIEGVPRRLDGVYHPVEVYYRDYRTVSGLQIPFVLETKVLPVPPPTTPSAAPRRRVEEPIPTEKTVFEKVVVNPKLDDSLFTKQSLDAAASAKPAPIAPSAPKPTK